MRPLQVQTAFLAMRGWSSTFAASAGVSGVTAAYMGVILTNGQTFALAMTTALLTAFVYRRWIVER